MSRGRQQRGALHLPLRTTSLLRAVPEPVQTGSVSDQEPKNGLIIKFSTQWCPYLLVPKLQIGLAECNANGYKLLAEWNANGYKFGLAECNANGLAECNANGYKSVVPASFIRLYSLN